VCVGVKVLELLSQMGVGFVVALSGTLLPGPMMAFIATRSLSFGPKTGFFAAMGHILVELGILALVVLGLDLLLRSPAFEIGIGVVGGSLLMVMGGFILANLRRAGKISPETSVVGYHPLIGGILFSTVLNPTVPLWWVTIGLVTLTRALVVAGTLGAVFWLLGHFTADVVWFSTVSLSVSKGKQLIGRRFHLGLLATCGSILVVFGSLFLREYLPLLF